AAGFRLVVISNQSGVARGYFSESALVPVANHLRALLAERSLPLMGFYYCPHHPDGYVRAYARNCPCRKPEPGLILRAAADHDLDLRRSWFLGDSNSDTAAGRRAGCGTILIGGVSRTRPRLAEENPDHVALDILEAARLILASRLEAAA